MSQSEIVILPAPRCRRSCRIVEYLERRGIPFTRVPLESPEGAALAAQHDLRASPGILVNGESINSFDLLIQPACHVDEEKAQATFTPDNAIKAK